MSNAKVISAGPPVSTNTLQAIGLKLLACFLFSLAFAIPRLVETSVPADILAVLRFATGLATVSVLLSFTGAGHVAPVQTPRLLHVVRAALAGLSITAGFYAATHMPLGDAMAIGFSSGPFVLLFGWLFLREKLTTGRVVALTLGLFGALLVAQPTGFSIDASMYGGVGVSGLFDLGLPALAAAFAALCISVETLTGRYVAQREHPYTILFQINMIGIVVAICLVAGGSLFRDGLPAVDPVSFLLLSLSGPAMTFGQVAHLKALAKVEAGMLAPVNYATIGFSTLLGFFLFGEAPDLFMILGCAFILSGAAVTSRQKR